MSITSIHKYAVDINADTLRDTLRTPLGMHNAQAQTFAVVVTEGGAPATLTGAGCTGYFIRADGYTVTISGTVSGNVAMVTLPAACYAVQGRCKLSVNVTIGSTIHTLLMVEGYADRTRTDAIVDDSKLIPSIDELLAQISAMEAATAASKTATSSANTAASAANTAAARANTAAEAAEGIADLTAKATTLEAGSSATASYANGVLTIGVPTGPQGPKGEKGDTGSAGPSTSVNKVAPVEGNVTLTAANVPMSATENTTVQAAVTAARKGKAVHNLLDNSDFTNPVNQRGVTTTTDTGYNIDRWLKNNVSGIFSVGNGYVSMQANGAYWFFEQNVSGLKSGKTYTVAFCDDNGDIVLESFVLSTTMTRETDKTFNTTKIAVKLAMAYKANGVYAVSLRGSDTTVLRLIWAALYEGEYTADTLPDYVPKGYAAELAECQRYYYQTWNGAKPASGSTIPGVETKTAIAAGRLAMVKFPVTMRISPTITLYTSDFIAASVRNWNDSSNTVRNVATMYGNPNGFMPYSAANAFTAGQTYSFHFSASADL